MEKIVIVFDGFCVLCNNYVRWVSERNPDKNIYFTNFDSVYIKKNYPKLNLGDTVFIIMISSTSFKFLGTQILPSFLRDSDINVNLD